MADTIERVMNANIRVWVLTGDKQETAIEIARSCKLIQKNMEEVILSSKSREEFRDKLRASAQKGVKGHLTIIIDG